MLLSGPPSNVLHTIAFLLLKLTLLLHVIAQLCIWDYSGQITFLMNDKNQTPVDCQRQSDQEVCSIICCLKLVCLCFDVLV